MAGLLALVHESCLSIFLSRICSRTREYQSENLRQLSMLSSMLHLSCRNFFPGECRIGRVHAVEWEEVLAFRPSSSLDCSHVAKLPRPKSKSVSFDLPTSHLRHCIGLFLSTHAVAVVLSCSGELVQQSRPRPGEQTIRAILDRSDLYPRLHLLMCSKLL